MSESITVYVRAGDPSCGAVLQQLHQRAVEFTLRDVDADPGAASELFGRLGRVVVPVVRIGERVLVGYDPVQLARFLPREEAAEEAVSFGAAVRGVTEQIAADKGLPSRFGVEVGRVVDGSVAAAAGVRAGDVITEIGGYTLLGGAEQFRTAVSARRPGDSMALTVWRDEKNLAISVTFPRAETTAEADDAGATADSPGDAGAAPGEDAAPHEA